MLDSTNLDGWLITTCTCCGSVNHIFMDVPDAHAWECWNCSERYWFDEVSRLDYIYNERIDEAEAEFRLDYGDLSIRFLNGQCDRE